MRRTAFPGDVPARRAPPILIDERTLAQLRREIGGSADRLVHDAGASVLGRFELEFAIAKVGYENATSTFVEYLPIGEAVSGGLVEKPVDDHGTNLPGAAHVMIIRLGVPGGEWLGPTLRIDADLPQTIVDLVPGRRLGDVVEGTGEDDRIATGCLAESSVKTIIRTDLVPIDTKTLVGRWARLAGPLRRLILESTRRRRVRRWTSIRDAS